MHNATHKETRPIAAAPDAHSWRQIAGTPSTCTTNGSGKRKCDLCDAEENSGVLDLDHNAHDWNAWEQIFSNCSGTQQISPTVATGLHTYGNYIQTTAPTCGSAGVDTRTCTTADCTASETRATATGAHSYGNYTQTTAPTCGTAGVETGTCTTAGCTATDMRSVVATGLHTYDAKGICTVCKSIEMVWVQGGSFDLGKNLGTGGGDITPVSTVTLTGLQSYPYRDTTYDRGNKMPNTQVRPVRDLRNRYSEIETFLENHNPVIITKNGRGTAVLINIDDYAEVEEYLHTKFINEKLKEAELEAAKPGAKWLGSKKVIKKMREKYCGS